MQSAPLVSVVVPFFNTPPQFMREAIESVIHQTYSNWEMLLVDDGSTNGSTQVAHSYAALYHNVNYLAHDGHHNRGASAARQLGIQFAKGPFIAFLDSDDVWLPHKLEEQIKILDRHPEADMLYGNTTYWHSWTGIAEDAERDYTPPLGIKPGTLVFPPALLPDYLDGRAAVPCPSSVVVRRKAIDSTGGFEDAFPGLFDDQVLYAKLCLSFTVFVSGECWDKYRQHPGSICASVADNMQLREAHVVYLRWLESYLRLRRIQHVEVWQALRRQLWLHQPAWPRLPDRAQDVERWTKKWLLRLEEAVLPDPLRCWLWTRRVRSR